MAAASASGPRAVPPYALLHPLPPFPAWLGDGDFDLEMITGAIADGQPLESVLDLVVERAWFLLGASETYVLLRDGDRLVGAAQRGLTAARPEEIAVPRDAGIEGWVAAHRRPLIVVDPARDARFRDLPQRPQPPGAICALPLVMDGKVLGVLVAATAGPADFAGDLALLLVLADLATLAIVDRSNRARDIRRARLVDLLRFVSAGDYEADLAGALAPLADRIAEVMGVEKVDLMFVDAERNALVSLGVSNTPLGQKQKEHGLDILPLNVPSLLATIVETGQSALVGDAAQDSRVYRPFVQELGIRSLLISPLAVGAERRGLISCAATQCGAFADEDLAVLDLIARRLSLALQHIELTDDLRRLEADRLACIEREDFLELLVHDLKNPLAALKGYTQLVERRLRAGDIAYAERTLGTISDKANQMGRLIDDLLDVARLAAGTFSLQRREFDLAALVRAEVEAAQATTAQHMLTVDAPAAQALWGDPDRIAEVVQNLLGNAVKYSPGGGAIRVTVGEAAGVAEIAVCDRGLGIAADDLPHVFDRAYRGRGAGAGDGLGLGLYISREIVRLHSGRIWAEPRPGGGTCFHMALPATRPA